MLRRLLFKLTDSETLRGNFTLIALAFAVMMLWGAVFCSNVGCAVDTYGLEAMASDAPGAHVRDMQPAGLDTPPTLPQADAGPADVQPPVADVLPPSLFDMRVADAGAPDARLPPDMPLPLLGLGVHCEMDSVCASGHCSGGYRVCAERMCTPCERGTPDGHCVVVPDDTACRGMRTTCEPLEENGKPCVFTQYVCKAGVCVIDNRDCCAHRRTCSTDYGCR